MVDQSQRMAARVVAVTYPLTLLVSILAYNRLYVPLQVWGDPAATVRNIAAHEATFRLYLAALLAYGVGVVVVLTGL